MPLSEHEQRLLEQMERALYEDDPKLASTLRGSDVRRAQRRRFVIAAIGFLLGIAGLLAGVVSQVWIVSIVGFVLMLVSVTYLITGWGKAPSVPAADGAQQRHPSGKGPGKAKAPRSKGSLTDRAEERWRKRRDEGL